jgi:hypothetical protein
MRCQTWCYIAASFCTPLALGYHCETATLRQHRDNGPSPRDTAAHTWDRTMSTAVSISQEFQHSIMVISAEPCSGRICEKFKASIWIVKTLLHVRPPLWSSGQSSRLQIQRSGFGSRRYQIFWEVVGLEQGPLSLVSTIEELLERKNSVSGLESLDYGRRDPSRWPRGLLHPQKLELTLPTSGGRSVGIVCSRTEATEFVACKAVRQWHWLSSD